MVKKLENDISKLVIQKDRKAESKKKPISIQEQVSMIFQEYKDGDVIFGKIILNLMDQDKSDIENVAKRILKIYNNIYNIMYGPRSYLNNSELSSLSSLNDFIRIYIIHEINNFLYAKIGNKDPDKDDYKESITQLYVSEEKNSKVQTSTSFVENDKKYYSHRFEKPFDLISRNTKFNGFTKEDEMFVNEVTKKYKKYGNSI